MLKTIPTNRRTLIFSVLAAIVLIFVPVFIRSPYYLHILIITGILSLLTLSLNLILGYTGQLSMAHYAFYGIGAYTSVILVTKIGLSFWLALPAAGIMAAAISFLIGIPSFRMSGIYFTIVTLAFGALARIVFYTWRAVTNGPDGFLGIPVPNAIRIPGIFEISFGSKVSFFYLMLFLVGITIVVIFNLVNSRVGDAFIAIREDEILAKAIGINTLKYKLLSFATSAFFAGIAGSLYAHYMMYISSEAFLEAGAVKVMAMVIIGGMGTLFGPVVGALIITVLPEAMRFIQDYSMIIFGLILIAIIIYMPKGIMGVIGNLSRLRGKRP